MPKKKQTPPPQSTKPIIKGEPLPKKIPTHQIWVPVTRAIALLKVGLLGSVQHDRNNFHLQGMVLKVSKRSLVTRATDGHVLFTHEVNLPAAWEHDFDLAVWIPSQDARRIVRELAEIVSDYSPYSALLEGDVVRTDATYTDGKFTSPEHIAHPPFIVFDSKASTYRHEIGTMKMRDPFPDEHVEMDRTLAKTLASARLAHDDVAKKVVPRRVALDARYLARAHRAARIVSRRSDGLNIHFADSCSPVIVQSTDLTQDDAWGSKLDMVIMPIALRGDDFRDWTQRAEVLAKPGRPVDAGPTDER